MGDLHVLLNARIARNVAPTQARQRGASVAIVDVHARWHSAMLAGGRATVSTHLRDDPQVHDAG